MSALPDPIDELGIYLLPGRVTNSYEGVTQAIEAEQLGLTSAWIAERFDTKELGVLSGAVAASTQRIKVGMGSIATSTRNPIVAAAMGATFVSAFPDRLLLGLARGLKGINDKHGMPSQNMQGFEDYTEILLKLWQGEEVSYDGPAGSYPSLRMPDPPGAKRPPIILSSWAPKAKATAIAARHYDGVFIGCELTVEATKNICDRLRAECERIGRDPASLWICNTMLCAPDLTDEEMNLQMEARMVTHLSFPSIGQLIMEENGWDQEPLDRVLAHPQMQGGEIADQAFTRQELADLGATLPSHWVKDGCAVGTSAEVVDRLREYLDAGLDHLVLHGSYPSQLTDMIRIWRETGGRHATVAGDPGVQATA
ncbi:TIGR03857 family LLM class F420-dependent oxidoreductase [Patulibacter sp. NPDC049589]|uniref:TIGR03857 family LLM class F420-dependent oxidoreductase n=1 Tax=Patulibacter sp. NPDC049589 TaxID=3154731 RepID=UPI0034205E8F